MLLNLNERDISEFYCFYKLKYKTQMFKNIDGVKLFLNRMNHTILVAKTASKIAVEKDLMKIGVDKERLFCSALLHDIGHTPYGHAGEEKINELFLSKDEINYSKYGSGSFKHNLNSVRLIQKYFFINLHKRDYILIDSILKHASTFPKQYDYSRFQEDDIFEQNYVLRLAHLAKSPLIQEFLVQFIDKANFCDCMTHCTIPNKSVCHYCEKQKSNLCFIHHDSAKYALSMYLSYPYPLTCEGTVLYWADEISCLCGDIHDVLVFIKYLLIKKNQKPILLSQFKCSINLLVARYGDNDVLNIILDSIRIVENKTIDFKSCKRRLKYRLLNLGNKNSLISLLIFSLETNDIRDNEIKLNFKNNHCDLLFKMDDKTNSIYKRIKTQIYSEIHSYRYIKRVNSNGKERIKQISKMFFNNLCLFMKEYHITTIGKLINPFKNIGSALYSTLRIDKKVQSKTSFKKAFKADFSNLAKPIKLNYRSLSKVDCLKKYLRSNTEGKKRVLQLFQREVLQFVASLPEKEIERYYSEKKYPVKINSKTRFPKDYTL